MRETSHPIYRGRKVLVLGDDYRMVLPIVRSLGRKGVEVHLAWCPADSPACQSRYAGPRHELPWYSATDHQWTRPLNVLAEGEHFDLIIPATEHAVYALQTNCEKLSRITRFYLLDDTAFRTVFDKQATYGLCEQEQIPYPKTVPIENRQEFDDSADEFRDQIVVKPNCSVSAEQTLGKAFVRRCQTRNEARDYVEHLLEQGVAVTLQQHVTGEGVGVELIAKGGRILTALQHRRLHETTGHGSTYRETTPIHDELLSACQRLIGALNYTGVAMVEFRVDPRTGEWSLIEVNGRFWGSLPLAAAAGIDFPLYLFQMLVEGETDFPRRYRTGVRSRALANDLRWLCRRASGKGAIFDAQNTDQLGWVPNDVPWSRVLGGVLRGLTLQDHLDAFAHDDMRPAFAELKCLCSDALRSIRQRLPQWRAWKPRYLQSLDKSMASRIS